MRHFNKVFVIGLPRTGTTSICYTMLQLGLKTAHCAYSRQTIEAAEVIADTPVFADYQSLDNRYPNSKFIYLERAETEWLPSILKLCRRMMRYLVYGIGKFHPLVRRSFSKVFGPLTINNLNSSEHLLGAYIRHRESVFEYFQSRQDSLMSIELSPDQRVNVLTDFLGVNSDLTFFPHLNSKGKITDWNILKHPLKVPSD